jgi:hypothetical protein
MPSCRAFKPGFPAECAGTLRTVYIRTQGTASAAADQKKNIMSTPKLSQLYAWQFCGDPNAAMPRLVDSWIMPKVGNSLQTAFYIAKLLEYNGVSDVSVVLEPAEGGAATEYNLDANEYGIRGDRQLTELQGECTIRELCDTILQEEDPQSYSSTCLYVTFASSKKINVRQAFQKTSSPKVGGPTDALTTINMADYTSWGGEVAELVEKLVLFPPAAPGLDFHFSPEPGGGSDGPAGLEAVNEGGGAVRLIPEKGPFVLFFEWLPIIFKQPKTREQYQGYEEYFESPAHAASVEAVEEVNGGVGWDETFLNPEGTGYPKNLGKTRFNLYDLVSATKDGGKIFRMNSTWPDTQLPAGKKVLKTNNPRIVLYNHPNPDKATAALFCVEYAYSAGSTHNSMPVLAAGDRAELRWDYKWNYEITPLPGASASHPWPTEPLLSTFFDRCVLAG